MHDIRHEILVRVYGIGHTQPETAKHTVIVYPLVALHCDEVIPLLCIATHALFGIAAIGTLSTIIERKVITQHN